MTKVLPIINQVLEHSYKNKLFNEGDFCLIGVSGGFDSVSLLNILIEIQPILKIKLAIAHVNYNLRGKASLEEELYVKILAEKYELPFYSLSINLNEMLIEKKASLEDLAREVRYSFFEKVALEHNYNKIALAHNANDQVETVLMKLIRGSVSGLKGIQAKRVFSLTNKKLHVIRPILTLPRKEIEAYCLQKKLEPKTDLSNFENNYTRNRIRNIILPSLLKENPNFMEIIENTSKVISEEDDFLQEIADKVYLLSIITQLNNRIILSHNKIKEEPYLIQRRIFKTAFQDLTQGQSSFSFKNLSAINNCIDKNTSNKTIELQNNYYFTKDRDYLIFHQGKLDFSSKEFNYELKLEQKNLIEDLKLTITVNKQSLFDTFEKEVNTIFFYCEDDFSLTLKNYDDKALFLPFGRTNPITTKEFLDKKKIPQLDRNSFKLLYLNDTLLWIIGIARSSTHLVDKNKHNFYFKVKILLNLN